MLGRSRKDKNSLKGMSA